ncbi:MAG: hypothetical protein Q7J29_04625 [Stagnimonas sp.]|nr:hypothetical protein [Stagnimonas sp.]
MPTSFARALARPKILAMLALGFASGLPFLLVGNTLGYWLREEGTTLSAIGYLSWVGLAYSSKFLWAPLIDRFDAPLLGWLGRRRGWMALSQLTVMAGLLGMAWLTPKGGLTAFALLALLTAFAAATQDIVIDAWRIETADNGEEQALLTSASQLGYRAALLITDALILILAAGVGWVVSYQWMAALMALGLMATWCAREPLGSALAGAAEPRLSLSSLGSMIVSPLRLFFVQHGATALLMLAAISLYRLPDFVLGPMANPFYADLGIAKETVGAVRASFGLVATFAGIAAAGLAALRYGLVPTLLAGAVLGPASNLAFAALAWHGPDPTWFAGAMVIDNFATGFAGTALVAYMSSLIGLGYTATQYALLSSFYALLGKTLKGFSGATVEALQAASTPMDGYALFFVGTAVIGLPALLLTAWLTRRTPAPARPSTPP